MLEILAVVGNYDHNFDTPIHLFEYVEEKIAKHRSDQILLFYINVSLGPVDRFAKGGPDRFLTIWRPGWKTSASSLEKGPGNLNHMGRRDPRRRVHSGFDLIGDGVEETM